MIHFERDITSDLSASASREWLETNGLGGFASSTISGMNTRRYHGLLFAAINPPVDRLLMLSKLEETVVINGTSYDLSTNQYDGAVHPEGYKYLKSYKQDPFPVFTFEINGVEIQKTVFMVHGENTTAVEYSLHRLGSGKETNSGLRDISLEIRPLIAFRDYHSTGHENDRINTRMQTERGLITLLPYLDMPPMFLSHNADSAEPAGFWYRNFVFQAEVERGFNDREDLFNPCVLRFDLARRGHASIIASTERRSASKAGELKRAELERRRSVVAPSRFNDPLARALVSAADQFVVARGTQKSIIAGYHWFGDWGRDTMIALPGIALLTGRIDVARSILQEFAKYVDEGMLPNRFPDGGQAPEYNTVDATLWFFHAIKAVAHQSGDYSFVEKNFYRVLVDIIDWHFRGTRYGIQVDDDGLLHAGEPGVQLTWMDAKVGDWVVTPRIGKPVEIQALWYNALRIMEEFAGRHGDVARQNSYREMADRAKASFNDKFWNYECGCLFDVVRDDHCDESIRPNQIFAISLPNQLVDPDRALSILQIVERELLTPYGLRSLAPSDPKYIGHYRGGPQDRDGAYHQGTVWSWLIGPFLSAYVRTHGETREARDQAARWLEPFRDHLNEAGLGQISEVFDGDAPHRPGGCIAQAWSVAEVLRASLEVAQNYGHRTWRPKGLQTSPVKASTASGD